MRRLVVGSLALFVAAVGTSATADQDDARDERVSRLEEQLAAVADELESLKTEQAVPEEIRLESEYGLGPAASKVYKRDKGLSLGGYGEVRLRQDVDDNPADEAIFDALRAVLYVGYKFNDLIVMNSEFEFEHAGNGGGGEVSTEFLTLDFMLDERVNARAGLLLIPMGFVNEMHEPNFYFGAERPEVERRIIPSTWRENGAGIFGTLFDRVSYRVYGVNGLEASGFSSSGLRGGRQDGSEALANHWGFVARADVDVFDGLLVGASVYTGKSGQEQSNSYCTALCEDADTDNDVDTTFEFPDALTTIYELHAQYKSHGLSLRALYAQAFVEDAKELNVALDKKAGDSIARRMEGGYAEIGYDVLPLMFEDTEMSLEPFFRYEFVDTQDQVAKGFSRNRNNDLDVYVVGASFKPHPQVVIKLDYRNFDAAEGDAPDEIQAGFGYVF